MHLITGMFRLWLLNSLLLVCEAPVDMASACKRFSSFILARCSHRTRKAFATTV